MTTFSGSELSVGNDSDDEPFLVDVFLGNQIASTLGNRNRDKLKGKLKKVNYFVQTKTATWREL